MEFPDWEGGVEVVWQGVGQLPRVHGQRLLSVAEQLRLPRSFPQHQGSREEEGEDGEGASQQQAEHLLDSALEGKLWQFLEES